MNNTRNIVHVSSRSWSSSLMFLGALLVLIGVWVALVALVGASFSFGFDTTRTWVGSERHWTLSIGPGLALVVAGLLTARGGVGRARLGALLGLVAGVWLVLGPFLHGIWSSDSQAIAGQDWKRALLWTGWYVGSGAAAVALSSYSLGLLGRQRFAGSVLVEAPAPPVEPMVRPGELTIPEAPVGEPVGDASEASA